MSNLPANKAILNSDMTSNAYVIVNGLAIVLSIFAACINLFIGPFNPLLWFVPLFQIGFAVVVHLGLNAWNKQAATDPLIIFCGRWIGKRWVDILNKVFVWNRRITTYFLRLLTPAVFLLISTGLLLAAISGTINPL